MSEHPPRGLSTEQRAQFRSFVRTHHPDRGGDPDVFVAGLAHYRELARPGPARPERAPARTVPDRYDAPIEIVRDLPFPVTVAVALIRTVRRRRHPRVDRPARRTDHAAHHDQQGHPPRRTS